MQHDPCHTAIQKGEAPTMKVTRIAPENLKAPAQGPSRPICEVTYTLRLSMILLLKGASVVITTVLSPNKAIAFSRYKRYFIHRLS